MNSKAAGLCSIAIVIVGFMVMMLNMSPMINPLVQDNSVAIISNEVNALLQPDVVVQPITVSSHSHALKHGTSEVATITSACNNGGKLYTFQKEFYKNGTPFRRQVDVCEVDIYFGLYFRDFIAGSEEDEELTAFLRRDANGNLVSDLEEVLHYLRSTGFKVCIFGCQ